ncbi:hypothetical protein JCM10450v2_004659 [Rhodotorula kratochvilovae]
MSSSALDLLTALRTAQIIPEVLPEPLTSSLKGDVRVHYPEHTISRGEAIPRAGTLPQPEIEFQEADTNTSYTLFMVDPDLLKHNDTLSGQVRHWFETGVKFDSTSKKTQISPGVGARNDYVPPSPAMGTGKHRYIFLLAKEPAGYSGPTGKDFPLTGKADLKDRLRFNVASYIQEEGLKLEGAGWMEVDADLAATKDNILLTAEAIKNKLTGQ